jgi:ribonuclease P protein component
MLARLTRRAEFVRAAQRGRKAASPNLVLQALPQPGEATRLGFTATKKIGNAVRRNRAKRRLRAAARLALGQDGAPGHDIVLIARDGTGTCPFPALLAELEAALRRTGARP